MFQLSQHASELVEAYHQAGAAPRNLKSVPAAAKIFDSEPAMQVEVVCVAAQRTVELLKAYFDSSDKSEAWSRKEVMKALLSALLRRKLPFCEESLELLVSTASAMRAEMPMELPLAGIVGAVEKFCGDGDVPEVLRPHLEKLHDEVSEVTYISGAPKILQRIKTLLTARDNRQSLRFTSGEVWSATLQNALDHFQSDAQSTWHALLDHCETANSAKPSKKWLNTATEVIKAIDRQQFIDTATETLLQIGKVGIPEHRQAFFYSHEPDPTQIHEVHCDLLRGLVWCTGLVPEEILIAAVGNAAEKCFQKLRGIGPRSQKIGNACVFALSQMNALAAVAQLSRLKIKIKQASSRKQIDKALNAAAERIGVTLSDLEELAVPTFGMQQVGVIEQTLGDFTARLIVSNARKPEITWLKPDGKSQKSVPKAVKEEHAESLRLFKQQGKDIEKMLPAQRDRIEQLFLARRTWTLGDFRKRYLDHPIIGTLARRLIWKFYDDTSRANALLHNGKLLGARGERLDWLNKETQVELWHPISSSQEDVIAWRARLETLGVQQPFKQAHREIYVLTDAELETSTYSNRFAGHILKQHQMSALCGQRGWRHSLQGSWDGGGDDVPAIHLPAWEMRAEFWLEGVGDHISEMGIYMYVSTDQVRFYRQDEEAPLSLDQVPPPVFSEVMRDVDLLVGVSSVGNDPTWADGGPDGGFHDYWTSYSLGELTASAQSRRETLERLLPKLKIFERCTILDRFLEVRGDIRTYKIHLGSSNIQMSPNDQYLCIVPDRATEVKGSVYLPFEGDTMLSVILSKAMLLAEDTKIKDPTILSQIS